MNLLNRCIGAGLAALALSAATVGASFAAYPEKGVTILVGFAAGGGADSQARLLAEKLSKTWNQTVIVENRPGADGTIAARAVAEAEPDGYTLLYITPNHVTTPAVRDLPYDAVKDFAAVTMVGSTPNLLVANPKVLEAKTLADFIAEAKAKPKQINFGSTGQLAPSYNAMALLAKGAGFEVENVFYNGSSAALLGLLNGEIQLMFGSPGRAMEYFADGRLVPLAISTRERSASLPDVPTVAEVTGLSDFDVGVWYGMLAPGGTPPDVIAKIYADVQAALKEPDVQKFLADSEVSIVASPPEEFGSFIASEIERWKAVVK